MKRIITIALLLITVYSATVSAQIQTTLVIDKGSSLTINGSTNMSKFRLVLSGDKFPSSIYHFTTTLSQNFITLSHNKLSLGVKNFTSGNIIALNGFLKLIQADSFPNLNIQLSNLEIVPGVPGDDKIHGKALVNITITGVTKQYSIPFSARNENGFHYADGKMRISIRDFGLIPPEEMMGLVKTSEWIEINLQIIAKIYF